MPWHSRSNETLGPEFTIRSSHRARQGRSLLRVSHIVFTIFEDSYCRPCIRQSCDYYNAVRYCDENQISGLRKSPQLCSPVLVRFRPLWLWRIDLAEVWQRGGDEEGDLEEEQDPASFKTRFKTSSYYRQTRMALEVDAAAHQILNRHRIIARDIHHKLTIPATPLPPEPLVISVRELWEDERRRRIALGLSPSPEVPKDLSEDSRATRTEWVAEARWWTKFGIVSRRKGP